MYDTIIIGAGPAGLTAAIYLRRANKKVLILEEKNYGGQIVNSLDIENYPTAPHISGFDFANKLYNQTKDFGTEIVFDKVIEIKSGRIKKVITAKKEYQTRSIIISTGCTNRKLDLPMEEELTGRGISYCATCDGNFYKNKDVAVIGGGNTALEDALYLSDIAKRVYLIHRRDALKGDMKTFELLQKKINVSFIYNSVVTKLIFHDKLEGIEIRDNTKKHEIKVDGLFVAIGQVPKTDFIEDIIKLDDKGYIVAKENCHTNKKGIFVAGDVRNKSIRQLVTATSDGATAAIEAINYLNNKK